MNYTRLRHKKNVRIYIFLFCYQEPSTLLYQKTGFLFKLKLMLHSITTSIARVTFLDNGKGSHVMIFLSILGFKRSNNINFV